MKVTLDKGLLQRRLKVIDRIVPRRGGLPFHYVVVITVEEDGTTEIWASSHKEGYVTRLAAVGEFEDGAAAVPAQELTRAVNAAPGDEVTITYGPAMTTTRVESGTARWMIETLAGTAPTPWPDAEAGEVGHIDEAELIRALQGARYAASKSESRPSFMQVHVGEGRVVAADGRRVHQESLGRVPELPVFDIPEKAVDTLLEALEAEGVPGAVGVSVDDEGAMTFRFGTMEYVIGRLNYPFPDIDSIVLERARAQKPTVVCSRDALVSAIKVAVVAIEDGGAVMLRFTNGVIEVSGSSQRGEGRMEVRCSNPDVPVMEIWLRAEDILEVLGRVPVEEDGDITFTMSADAGDPGWVYIQSGATEVALRPVVS